MSGYTRQQTYTAGETILAEHTNDEYDALQEAFDVSLGHKHDGTAGEGPLIKNLDEDTTVNGFSVFNVKSDILTTEDLINGIVVPFTDTVDTLGYSSEGDGGAAKWRKTGVTGLTASQSPADLIDTKLTDAAGAEWELVNNGPLDMLKIGVVGGGANEAALLQAAFSYGDVLLPPFEVLSLSTTLTITHPCRIQGAGSDRSSIVFEDMGGFSGSDGIFVDVPEDAEFMSSSSFSGFTIKAKGAHGRHGITTRRSLTTHPSNIWSVVRPHYEFHDVVMTGYTRVSSGSLVKFDYGWARYFDIGDSDRPRFEGCAIGGVFDDDLDPTLSPALENKETSGWFFGGLDDPDGGAVYMPQLRDCATHFVGKSVEFGRRVSDPDVDDCQFHRGGYGIFSDRIWLGTDAGVSESQFSNLNINASFGGISIADTNFCSMTDVRCTRSDDTFDHGLEWRGFSFYNDFRRVKLEGCRSYMAGSAGYSSVTKGAYFANGGVVDVKAHFSRNDDATNPVEAVIELEDVGQAGINGVHTIGTTDAAVSIKGSVNYTPALDIRGVTGDSNLTAEVVFDSNTQRKHVIEDLFGTIKGVDSTTTTKDDDEVLLVNPKEANQLLRYAFLAGASGAYTFDFKMTEENAGEGDLQHFWIQFNASAGTDPTVRFLDENDAVQFSVTGDGTLKRYSVTMVYLGTTWRVMRANESLA